MSISVIVGATVILSLGVVAIMGGALCIWLGVLASRKEKLFDEAAEGREQGIL